MLKKYFSMQMHGFYEWLDETDNEIALYESSWDTYPVKLYVH